MAPSRPPKTSSRSSRRRIVTEWYSVNPVTAVLKVLRWSRTNARRFSGAWGSTLIRRALMPGPQELSGRGTAAVALPGEAMLAAGEVFPKLAHDLLEALGGSPLLLGELPALHGGLTALHGGLTALFVGAPAVGQHFDAHVAHLDAHVAELFQADGCPHRDCARQDRGPPSTQSIAPRIALQRTFADTVPGRPALTSTAGT